MTDAVAIQLLRAHLKQLRLPAMGLEFEKLAREAADSNRSHEQFLLQLAEIELAARAANALAAWIKQAEFPVLKDFDTYDFSVMPQLSKPKVLELSRGEWIEQKYNSCFIGSPGTGKTHLALALGQAFDQALGNRNGIVRMGDCFAPMDETLAHVAVDLSGRPYTVVQAEWHTPYVGNVPTTLFPHFFESFAVTARCNLHVRVLYGRDDHHQAEALFKAWARALDAASQFDPRRGGSIPSTKGSL